MQLSYPKWVPPRLPSIRPVPDIAGAVRKTAPDNAGAAADGQYRAIMVRPTLRHVFVAGFMGLALAACSPSVDTRGNLADKDRLQQIQPGVSTRDDVAAVLGTPSTMGTFDPNTWYYIGARTEKTAFFRPDTVERKVVVVKFDEAGTVADVHQLDQSAGKEVELVERTTPTAGRDMNFIEQMLGNVGRFSGGNGGFRQPGVPRR
ncbi:MAG TPA: outer membrane protein assembly factor BamE [Skermanella sp.]|nr:outer membrane protein assembly factor BamE [Skermanella sp.]